MLPSLISCALTMAVATTTGKGVSVPVRLLHESEGHVCTIELRTGETYRGTLLQSEDNWNVQLTSVTYTARDGRVSQLEHVFLRGSKVRFIIVPDMLKNAPMFKKLGGGGGGGRAATKGKK